MVIYTKSIKPNNSIDFDQSVGAISILSNQFELAFGKFKTSLGPFYQGNLSISDYSPPFSQLFFKFKMSFANQNSIELNQFVIDSN